MSNTTKGKKNALKLLQERRESNKKIVKVDNGKLYAGSPMYYYCISCNKEMCVPESHIGAAPNLCVDCKDMKDCGWLK